MEIKKSLARGTVSAPPSKSMAHRHLICSALSDGKCTVSNVHFSQDILATLGCIKTLGADVKVEGNSVIVNGIGASLFDGRKKTRAGASITVGESSNTQTVSTMQTTTAAQTAAQTPSQKGARQFDCNESGSTLRFFIPISLMDSSASIFTGSRVLMSRPLSVYEEICRRQGIRFELSERGLETSGLLRSGTFTVPGNISSQFVTGLLYVLPVLDGDSTIVLTDTVESRSYIDMTLLVQKIFGITAVWKDERTLYVPGNQKYRAKDSVVEGDFSNSAFLEAFNFLGGNVNVLGLNEQSLQGDRIYREYFKKLASGFCTLDVSDCPDLGPILFTVAAALEGAEFTGTRRLKIKESDRGFAMCRELSKFGVKTLLEENRIVVYRSDLKSPTEELDGHNDHRIVMALATLLALTGGKINGSSAVRKSFPDYFKQVRKLGIKAQEEDWESDL